MKIYNVGKALVILAEHLMQLYHIPGHAIVAVINNQDNTSAKT